MSNEGHISKFLDELISDGARKRISVENGQIVIYGAYEYAISLDRCNTAEKILRWVIHLSEKNWMSLDLMEAFIQAAADANNIDIPLDI